MAKMELEDLLRVAGTTVVRAVVRLASEHVRSHAATDYSEDETPQMAFSDMVLELNDQLDVPLVRKRLAELIKEELG